MSRRLREFLSTRTGRGGGVTTALFLFHYGLYWGGGDSYRVLSKLCYVRSENYVLWCPFSIIWNYTNSLSPLISVINQLDAQILVL